MVLNFTAEGRTEDLSLISTIITAEGGVQASVTGYSVRWFFKQLDPTLKYGSINVVVFSGEQLPVKLAAS